MVLALLVVLVLAIPLQTTGRLVPEVSEGDFFLLLVYACGGLCVMWALLFSKAIDTASYLPRPLHYLIQPFNVNNESHRASSWAKKALVTVERG